MTDPSSPLVRAAIAGDHAALLALLEAARPDIRRYARSTCRAADIDDAVQETLWVVYRRIGTVRAAAAFPAWLFAVVRRACLRLARSVGLVSSDGEAQEAAALAQTDADLRLDIVKAIQSLPDHYRVIVVMRDLEERTINEIGQALGETREAVKARLHRARVLLRAQLLR
jgi:RNA polymerase sigma-70 factor (ECF subfamily)